MPALQTNRTALVGLQRIEILEGLELPLIEALAKRLNWHQVRTSERVISREDPDRDVYLVVGGRVQVAAFSPGGKQKPIVRSDQVSCSANLQRSTDAGVRPM